MCVCVRWEMRRSFSEYVNLQEAVSMCLGACEGAVSKSSCGCW